MKTAKTIFCIALFLILGAFSVRAQTTDEVYREQLDASGANTLFRSLPEDTKDLLRRLGIESLEAESFSETDAKTWMEELWHIVQTVVRGPLTACGMVLGVLLIYAWVDGARRTLHTEEVSPVFGVICTLSACGAVMLPLADQLTQVSEAMESVSVFMMSFIPVYATVLTTAGQLSAALSFQSVVFYAAQLLSWVAGAAVVPLLSVSMALGLTGSLTPELKVGRIGTMIGKTATWMLTFGMVLFTGILSIQSLAGSAADKLSTRALRFSISHFVPIVGGSLSEAFATVRGCLHMLRSTLGCFGIVATVLIVLPPLLSCVCWNIVLSIGETTSEMFELSSFTELLKTAHGITRCLVGVLCVSGLLLTVSLTVVTIAAGGAV